MHRVFTAGKRHYIRGCAGIILIGCGLVLASLASNCHQASADFALLEAIHSNSALGVRLALAKGADVQCRDTDDLPFLPARLQFLQRVLPHHTTSDTPLVTASRIYGIEPEIIDCLLKKEASQNREALKIATMNLEDMIGQARRRPYSPIIAGKSETRQNNLKTYQSYWLLRARWESKAPYLEPRSY